MTYRQLLLVIYVIYIILVSFVTYVAFLLDKQKAIKGKMRTKEKTLLFLSAFGGGFGAFLGRIINHHKTDKSYFSIIIYFSMIIEEKINKKFENMNMKTEKKISGIK